MWEAVYIQILFASEKIINKKIEKNYVSSPESPVSGFVGCGSGISGLVSYSEGAYSNPILFENLDTVISLEFKNKSKANL